MPFVKLQLCLVMQGIPMVKIVSNIFCTADFDKAIDGPCHKKRKKKRKKKKENKSTV